MRFLKVAIAVISIFLFFALANLIGAASDFESSVAGAQSALGAARILFFVVLVVLFFLGAIHNVKRRGKEGQERISRHKGSSRDEEITFDWSFVSK